MEAEFSKAVMMATRIAVLSVPLLATNQATAMAAIRTVPACNKKCMRLFWHDVAGHDIRAHADCF